MSARPYGRELLRLARTSIERALAGEPAPSLLERPHPDDPSHGVFVTLRIGEELRGCIGTLAENQAESPYQYTFTGTGFTGDNV